MSKTGQRDGIAVQVAPPAVPTLLPWQTPLTRSLRTKFFLAGVIFPLMCLTAIILGDLQVDDNPWQSGRLSDHVTVLLSDPAIATFLPLLAVSFVCLASWCLVPATSRSRLIRIGLWTGFLQALMFSVLLCITTGVLSGFLAIVLGALLSGSVWLVNRILRKRFSIAYLMALTLGVALITALVPLASHYSGLPISQLVTPWFALFSISMMGGAAPLGMVAFLRAAVAAESIDGNPALLTPSAENLGPVDGLAQAKQKEGLGRPGSPSIRWPLPLAVWLTWTGGMGLTWRYAIEQQAIEYAKLPTVAPNCFVSSAAANGHPAWVGLSHELAGGGRVNMQMQRLKLLEFAVKAATPRLHCCIRIVYNRGGPMAARWCRRSIWLADVAFVLLKPLEWWAIGIQLATGISPEQVRKIYKSPARRSG